MLNDSKMETTKFDPSEAEFHIQRARELRSEHTAVMMSGFVKAVKKVLTFELPSFFTGPLANR